MYNKITEILRKTIIVLFIIIFSYVLILNIQEIKEEPLLIISLILAIIGSLLISKIPNFNIKNKYIKGILIILLYISILTIGLLTRVDLTWDYGELINSTYKYCTGGQESYYYFARYPNNIPLFIIEIILCKICLFFRPDMTVVGLHTATILLNSIIVFLNILLMCYITNKINGSKNKIGTITILLFSPLVLYTAILYTDTIGILIMSLITFIYYLYSKSITKKQKIILSIIMCILLAFGFKMKATTIFPLIAIVINMLYEKKFVQPISLIALTIIMLIPVNLLLDMNYKVTEENEKKFGFPYSHWIMMSLNPLTEGGYITEDVVFTMSLKDIDERKKVTVEEIKNRLKDYGVKGSLERIFYTKPNRTWTDPTFYTENKLARKADSEDNLLQSFVHWKGKNNIYYLVYITTIYYVILIGILKSGIKTFKEHNRFIFYSQLLLIGIFMFELVWECNPRYIYTFIPFMIICATYGLTNNRKEMKENES